MAKHLCWILFVLSFTGTLNAGGVIEAPLPLEHFQCYPVLRANPEVEAGVGLFDQFTLSLGTNLSDRFEKVRVLGASWFCNPTRKLHNGQAFDVRDVRQHLTFYWIRAERREPQRVVKIQNQFGEQSLRLHESLFLAVPTKKADHDAPLDLDHFKCYRATGARVRRPMVGLSDQFILPVTRHRVRKPVAFCNPVEKLHTDFIVPIRNEESHLTCYSMTAANTFVGRTEISNQFGSQGLLVGTPRVLCVPTRKQGFEVIPLPDGTVGAGLRTR